jgi:cytochrome c5
MTLPAARLLALFLVLALLAAFDVRLSSRSPAVVSPPQTLTDREARGRDVWFNETFGGERFFSLVLPGPPFNLPLGFEAILRSDRSTRFDQFGVLNDPDCEAGDASTDYLDRCPDPNATGIVGMRRFRTGPSTLYGFSCAACHAGLSPENPPHDPNHPAWENIHPTTGNQFLRIGRLFGANLSPHDARRQVFESWAPGTVDTTALESDHINNPGIITQVFNLPDRPFFDLTLGGEPMRVHRAGQGGEDDAGCERAALRVYFNIGMCAAECMIGHLDNGPGGTQTPIDVEQCRRDCPDFRRAEAGVGDLCAFIDTPKVPRLRSAPGGQAFVDNTVVAQGQRVFERTCASCHSNGQPAPQNVFSDDLVHPAEDIGTNSCRARTTNWMAGRIWSAFSSDQYKARPTGGPGFYRDVPLLGIWATAPFFHNNRLGPYSGDPSVRGRVAAFEAAADQLLNPWKRDFFGSIQTTTDWILVPSPSGALILPAGTPIALFASRNPRDPAANLCPELVENQGHYFGWALPPAEKRALIEYLKTL